MNTGGITKRGGEGRHCAVKGGETEREENCTREKK
jgi:hypothetical protein